MTAQAVQSQQLRLSVLSPRNDSQASPAQTPKRPHSGPQLQLRERIGGVVGPELSYYELGLPASAPVQLNLAPVPVPSLDGKHAGCLLNYYTSSARVLRECRSLTLDTAVTTVSRLPSHHLCVLFCRPACRYCFLQCIQATPGPDSTQAAWTAW
jgi:hypothetical protein